MDANKEPLRWATHKDGDASQETGKPKKFGKGQTMLTAKNQVANRQRAEREAQDAQYLGDPPDPPPPNQTFLNCRLVLPGEHRLPSGLDSPEAFDKIRRQHKVWITKPEPYILDFICASISGLKEALRAVNWILHDMRLSNDHPVIRFFVQAPTKASADASIKFELGSRPHVKDRALEPSNIESAADRLLQHMKDYLRPESQTLMAIDKDLTMRVNFGLLKVRQKRKTAGNELPYQEFGETLKEYSLRGGASLDTKLPHVHLAERTLQQLLDTGVGVFMSDREVTYGCNLTLVCQDGELRSDVKVQGSEAKLRETTITTPELSARLDWTTAAPDMPYDWDLRVDAGESMAVPKDLQALIDKVSLKFDYNVGAGLRSMKFPNLQVRFAGQAGAQVNETRLQMTATIPYKETVWAIEITITHAWKGLNVAVQPDVYWGVHVYGLHWENCINNLEVDGRRKDWGQDLTYMWPGDTLHDGFGEFLQSVMAILGELKGETEVETSLL